MRQSERVPAKYNHLRQILRVDNLTWRKEPTKIDRLLSGLCHSIKFGLRSSIGFRVRVRVGFRVGVRVGFRVRVSLVSNIN